MYSRNEYRSFIHIFNDNIRLLFCEGDNYYTYDESAVVLSEILGIVTYRNKSGEIGLRFDPIQVPDIDDYLYCTDIEDCYVYSRQPITVEMMYRNPKRHDSTVYIEEDSENAVTRRIAPTSALFSVIVDVNNTEKKEIFAVSDLGDQNTSNGFYHIERGLPCKLLSAVIKHRNTEALKTVESNGSTYSIDYNTFICWNEQFENVISDLSNPEYIDTIDVYRTIPFNLEQDNFCEKVALVWSDDDVLFPIKVFFNKTTSRSFISYDALNKYLQGRFLYLKPVFDQRSFDGHLNDMSPLKLYGYSVSTAEGLADSQRQNILSRLIDRNIMTKMDIEMYLQFFIRLNQNSPALENAVNTWKRDLTFVHNYGVRNGIPIARTL